MMLFGDSGSGRTSFIGSGGKDYKILLIRPPADHVDAIVGSGVKEVIASDHEDMTDILEMLRHSEPGEWDWVWWDSVSVWQDFGLQDVYEAALDRAGPPGSKARKHRASFASDKGEFRINAERISGYLRELSGSEAYNFGITAHAYWGKRLKIDPDDEESDDSMVLPWIQVKGMISKTCGYMNIVGYLDVAMNERTNKEYRRMLTNKHPQVYCKNQYKDANGVSVFGEDGIMVNPTLPKVMAAIERAKPQNGAASPRPRRKTRRT